jgi:predicted Fe-Mo cluster-binding NifX family protein
MKAAFAIWRHRICPVFDVARQIHLVGMRGERIVDASTVSLTSDDPLQKALLLVALGVDVLVCGAISRQIRHAIEGYGIRVMPFVAGDLEPVISAWLDGTLAEDRFVMPGCRGRQQDDLRRTAPEPERESPVRERRAGVRRLKS